MFVLFTFLAFSGNFNVIFKILVLFFTLCVICVR